MFDRENNPYDSHNHHFFDVKCDLNFEYYKVDQHYELYNNKKIKRILWKKTNQKHIFHLRMIRLFEKQQNFVFYFI